jgi:hypothetical protein
MASTSIGMAILVSRAVALYPAGRPWRPKAAPVLDALELAARQWAAADGTIGIRRHEA